MFRQRNVWLSPQLNPKISCEFRPSEQIFPEKNCWVLLNLNEFITATVVSQVLFLNLINFQKSNAKRAVGKSRAEVFSLKKNKSTLLFPQRSALFLPLCFPLSFFIIWQIIEQLKCTEFWGPISMKERFQFYLYISKNELQFLQFKSV